ncbi:MAG: hypothetical protein OXP69_02270 [Spirochaetaceae bacterium]|nr:hypothetical protein [Spirochaetaceae bacterium]
MNIRELIAEPLMQVLPEGFSLSEVVVRLARADERVRWDALMDRHHYLGFKRFAGRGLRYLAEWRGQWLALAGWQTCESASKVTPGRRSKGPPFPAGRSGCKPGRAPRHAGAPWRARVATSSVRLINPGLLVRILGAI